MKISPWYQIARELASALNDSPCGEWGSKDRALRIFSEMKEAATSEMSFPGYFSDYPQIPIGGGNPYNQCAHCHISAPQINGELDGHAEYCKYKIKKEQELMDKFLMEIFNQEF